MSTEKEGSDLLKAGGFLRTFRLRRDRLLIEVAEELKINPSVLSQLETGHRLLTDKYISRIRDANFLDADELRLLREKAAVDVSKRKIGVDVTPKTKQLEVSHAKSDECSSGIKAFDIRSLPEFLDNIRKDLERNDQIIICGMTKNVSRWLEKNTLPILWRKVDQTMNHAPSEAWLLQKYLSKAIVQYAVSHVYGMTSNEAASVLRQCAVDLEFLAQTSNKQFPRVLAYYCYSYADYNENKNLSSLGNASLGIMLAKKNKIPDKSIFLNFYVLIAIASAKMGDKHKAIENINNLRDLLNSPEVSSKEYRGVLNTIAMVKRAKGSKKFWKNNEENKVGIEGNRKGIREPFNMLTNFWALFVAM